MVLFKFCVTPRTKASTCIYIPLWSYSNVDEMSTQINSRSIYIPLWSYSNGIAEALLIAEYGIYIPLWSYSNDINAHFDKMIDLFTFHYGPIQME